MQTSLIKEWLFTVSPMGVLLTVLILSISLFFYLGQRGDNRFNFWDAFMSGGETSIVAILFFGSWVGTTWIIIHREISGTLDSAFFNTYCMFWVSPLLARVGIKAWKSTNDKEKAE